MYHYYYFTIGHHGLHFVLDHHDSLLFVFSDHHHPDPLLAKAVHSDLVGHVVVAVAVGG